MSTKSCKKSGSNRKDNASSSTHKNAEKTNVESPRERPLRLPVTVVVVAVAAICWGCWAAFLRDDDQSDATPNGPELPVPQSVLLIKYPTDGTMFPPEISTPTFRWTDSAREADRWLIEVELANFPSESIWQIVETNTWTPTDEQWVLMKRESVEQSLRVAVSGFHHSDQDQIKTNDSVDILTSTDEVGASIFYREVNLPFSAAVRDPAAHIRWRFGEVSSKEAPKIVLENMPVCGNCHSFWV